MGYEMTNMVKKVKQTKNQTKYQIFEKEASQMDNLVQIRFICYLLFKKVVIQCQRLNSEQISDNLHCHDIVFSIQFLIIFSSK